MFENVKTGDTAEGSSSGRQVFEEAWEVIELEGVTEVVTVATVGFKSGYKEAEAV